MIEKFRRLVRPISLVGFGALVMVLSAGVWRVASADEAPGLVRRDSPDSVDRVGQVSSTPTAPSTQPSESLDQLTRELGDDDFHVRREAARKLRTMGKAAVPALTEAKKSPDPEVHASAEEILAEIEMPPVTTLPLPQASGISPRSTSVSVLNGVKSVDITEPGRTTHIDEDLAGLKMTVTGQIDGQQVKREYKAKNAEQLKKENPEAYALYLQGGSVVGNGVHVNVNFAFGGMAPRIQQPLRIIPFLGIMVREEAQTGKGLPIVQVIPGSRAEKMGLKERDLITRINGKQVHATLELRRAFTVLPQAIVIEATRNGKTLKLSDEPQPQTREAGR